MRITNKKGADIPSVIFITVMVVAIGILFLFTHNLTQSVYNEFGDAIEEMPQYDNNTEAVKAIRSIEAQNEVVWDYAFIFIAVFSLFALF